MENALPVRSSLSVTQGLLGISGPFEDLEFSEHIVLALY